jgi:hypothetical protein
MRQRIEKLRKKPTPPPPVAPPAPAASFRTQPLDLVLARIGLPGALVRQIAADFQDLRPWWPILIPVAIYVAITTYRRERAQVLAAKKQPSNS